LLIFLFAGLIFFCGDRVGFLVAFYPVLCVSPPSPFPFTLPSFLTLNPRCQWPRFSPIPGVGFSSFPCCPPLPLCCRTQPAVDVLQESVFSLAALFPVRSPRVVMLRFSCSGLAQQRGLEAFNPMVFPVSLQLPVRYFGTSPFALFYCFYMTLGYDV